MAMGLMLEPPGGGALAAGKSLKTGSLNKGPKGAQKPICKVAFWWSIRLEKPRCDATREGRQSARQASPAMRVVSNHIRPRSLRKVWPQDGRHLQRSRWRQYLSRPAFTLDGTY